MITESSEVLDFCCEVALPLLQHELQLVTSVGTGGHPFDALHHLLFNGHLAIVALAVPFEATIVQAEFTGNLHQGERRKYSNQQAAQNGACLDI